MQKLILIFSLFLIVHISVAQDSGIQFSEGNWETMLKKASEEKKIIFVDAYTTWCGPCKKMAKDVFTKPDVGAYYNDQFINAKIDMEKGEGILFARAYGVNAYPTLLFIDQRGNMVHKALGYRSADAFVQLGKSASDPNMSIGGLTEKFKSGNREPEFLNHYAITLSEARHKDAGTAVKAYLETQNDWLSGDLPEFIFNYSDDDPNSKLVQYILDNRQVFEEKVGQDKLDNKLAYIALRTVDRKERSDRDVLVSAYTTFFPERGTQMADRYLLQNLARRKDDAGINDFFKAAKAYVSSYKVDDWQLLNSIAWHAYEITDDKDHLKHAKKWAKTSTELYSSYYNYDTLAAICYKLAEKADGVKYAEKAIALAKETGSEAEETQALLIKLQALD
jgi:thioredoxin-related protein